MPVIRIPTSLYQRLEKYAEGFDTPVHVIERLLNEHEGLETSPTPTSHETPEKPILTFTPNEETFRLHLVENKRAKVVLHYSDGTTEQKDWIANNFKETSNLRGNIWSGYLRGWKDNHITTADFIAT